MAIVIWTFLLLLLAAVGVHVLYLRLGCPPNRGELESAIDRELEKCLKLIGPSQGIVVGALKDGHSYFKSLGSLGATNLGIAPERTGFEIGSLTKLFTAAVLQKLSDKGIAQLDASLADTFPETNLAPALQTISLRLLATHHAGIPSIPDSIAQRFPDLEQISHGFAPADLHRYLENPDGLKSPGHFAYSNLGFGILGHALSAITGLSYARLVTDYILHPLAMNDTGAAPVKEEIADLAQGHRRDGQPTGWLRWEGGSLEAAGCIRSTAADLLRFVEGILETNESVLNHALRKTLEPQMAGSTGLGWMMPSILDRLAGNRSVRWHNGMTAGFSAYLAVDPPTRSGVVLLTNRAVDITLPGILLMRLVRTQSWADKPIPTAKSAIADDRSRATDIRTSEDHPG